MNHRRISKLSFGSVFLVFLSLSAAQPALAGFKWIGSDEVQSTNVMVAPSAPAGSMPMDPIVISGAPPKATMPQTLPSVMDLSVQAPKAESADVVKGFADSVPLSVALRQVLPPNVGFSVSQDVSLGTLVSWRGGAPWRQVMKDMLLPAGLTTKEDGMVVHVVRAGGVAPSDMPLADANSLPPLPPKESLPPIESSKPMTLLAPVKEDVKAPTSLSVPTQTKPALASAEGYLTPPRSLLSAPSAPAPQSYGMPDVSVGAWTAASGDMLKKTLEDWGRRANVDVSWQAEYDYPIQATVSLSGNFEEAVRSLLSGFEDATPQPVGYLYSNQAAGQTVLVVQARGNNYRD